MNVFICHNTEAEIAFLADEEAYHCHKVLRKSKGQLIDLIDGHGTFYQGILLESSKTKCTIKIQNKWKEKSKGYKLHIAIAPTKNMGRFEWFLEKAIEIGIDVISPVVCAHSERKTVNMDRLNRIAKGAVKQSLRAFVPRINKPERFGNFLTNVEEEIRVVAHLDETAKHLKKIIRPNGSYLVFIGPEGDFSVEELATFQKQQWQMAILGNNRLRTETAGVVACQIANDIHF